MMKYSKSRLQKCKESSIESGMDLQVFKMFARGKNPRNISKNGWTRDVCVKFCLGFSGSGYLYPGERKRARSDKTSRRDKGSSRRDL
jgi:hypothetical protein